MLEYVKRCADDIVDGSKRRGKTEFFCGEVCRRISKYCLAN